MLLTRPDGNPRLLPLTLLAVFLLTTGRWGSYLGLPSASVYISDVALVLTAGWLILRHRRAFRTWLVRPLTPVLVLVAWAAIRFAIGGRYDLLAARDLAPYGYMLVVLMACFAAAYGRTLQVLIGGLILHLLWVFLVLLAPTTPDHLPLLGDKVRVLEIRPDFDGAVLVTTAGLAFYLATRAGQGRMIRTAWCGVALLCAALLFPLGSRSGVLALVVITVILLGSRLHLLRRLGWRRGVALVAVIVAVGVVLVPQTYLFTRITADPRLPYAGAGTINARQLSWQLVIEDAAEEPGRLTVGSGFGRDFLEESGARFAIEGPVSSNVRAPHNFVLNTLGRLGLLGVLLLGWAGIQLAIAGFRVVRSKRPDDQGLFSSYCVLLLAALGVASMLGVILESPFGAIPFWWAAGHVLVTGQRNQRLAAAEDDPSNP